jgi:archaemetzincin
MNRFLIVPVEKIETYIIKSISHALEKAFDGRVSVITPISIPKESFEPKRKQYYSTIILETLRNLKVKGIDRVLGITDVDLYVPGLNFIFGEADTGSGIALISLKRLRQEFYGLRHDEKLFSERAIKESIHEIGHTYGLSHCHDETCIMYFSKTLRETDIKGPGFCAVCINKLKT